MYELTQSIDTLLLSAQKIKIEKMKKYDHLMIIIENFIIENNIIVNISYINDNKYFFDLYTSDMFELPKKLTLLLYKSDPVVAKYVTLNIKIYKYHSKIFLDNINFVQFTYLSNDIKKKILKYKCLGIFNNISYYCFGPEIQLINLYSDITNIKYLSKWEDILQIEKILSLNIENDLMKRIKSKNDIIGGNFLNKKILKILNNFISKDHVIIGQFAIIIYEKIINLNNLNKIEIISNKNFDDEIESIKKLFNKDEITYSISNIKLPTNLNIQKLSISITKNNVKKVILDIFNNSKFEIIPYNKLDFFKITNGNKIPINLKSKIASPFIVKKFKLIDIWHALNIYQYCMNNEKIINAISYMIHDFKIMNHIDISEPEILFPIHFIGTYKDEYLENERKAVKLKIRYIPSYIPYLIKDT